MSAALPKMTLLPNKMPWQLLRNTVDYILSVQADDGAIAWFSGGKLDPWDHVEAAMGLAIGGELAAAQRAYEWLFAQQLDDGSWYSHYQHNIAQDTHHRETHFVAYIAVGLFHYALISGDWPYVRSRYPNLQRALAFVLRYQSAEGEIYWAVNGAGVAHEDALITASSSIYKSLQCAILISEALGEEALEWRAAYHALGAALRAKPERFDRTWAPKTRFSMDWFYPVLSGVWNREQSLARLQSRWQEFVYAPLGCRCVSDEPWVTVAESCELILALNAVGEKTQALQLFSTIMSLQAQDGGFWTGINYVQQQIWPEEKTTWTAGAVLLAADALFNYSDAAGLFSVAGGIYSILPEN